MSEFEGRTAIITGASRGVGRDMAFSLGAAHANIVVNYTASDDDAARVADEIIAGGGNAHLCKADVSRSADVERLFSETVEKFGGVDILINNAGINVDRPLLELKEDEWDAVIDVNLKGTFLCTQAAGKIMSAARSGHIVNISAVTSLDARRNAINYCVSKAGVNMITKCAALELAPHVRVNGLALGFFRSEAVDKYFTEEQISEVVEATPARRMGEFREITSAARFLLSDASSFITGQTIIVDGGRVMR